MMPWNGPCNSAPQRCSAPPKRLGKSFAKGFPGRKTGDSRAPFRHCVRSIKCCEFQHRRPAARCRSFPIGTNFTLLHSMKFSQKVSLLILTFGLLAAAARGARADVLVTDFSATNPLSAAYDASTWASPDQFRFFTDGSVSGQENVPLGLGSPTVSGGAMGGAMNLDLRGENSLELTLRLLPSNQARLIQVMLVDADGTQVRFDFATSSFNLETFAAATLSFSSAATTADGSVAGLNLSSIISYAVQGDYFDGKGHNLLQLQLDNLGAVNVVPEPATMTITTTGFLTLAGICILRKRRQHRA